jgi:uncharacterized membrane protein required for colicin V production
MILAFDLVILALVMTYFFKGVNRGFLLSILGIIGLACAYWSSYHFARDIGSWMTTTFEINKLLANLLGGGLVFISVLLIFGLLVTTPLYRLQKHGGMIISLPNHLLGGLFSLLISGLVISTTAWGYQLARQSHALNPYLPNLRDSQTIQISQTLIQYFSTQALKRLDSQSQLAMVVRFAGNPEQVSNTLPKLVEQPSIQELLTDPYFAEAVLSGNETHIAANPTFRNLLGDHETMQQLQQLGLVSSDELTKDSSQQLVSVLANTGQRINRMRQDPLFQEKLQKLVDEGALEENDPQKLLMNPHFQELLEHFAFE